MPARSVLEALGLAPFDELVPEPFRTRFGLEPAGQYGLACPDVPRARDRLEALGGGAFVGARVPAPGWTEGGRRQRCRLDFALGDCDGEQVELLGPGRGTTFYSDALDGDELVLHHVGIFQTGIRSIEARLVDGGYPIAVTGGVRIPGLYAFEFTYLDTRDELGFYLEILDFRGLGGRPLDLRPLVRRAGRLRARAGPRAA